MADAPFGRYRRVSQLPLGLRLDQSAVFETFVAGGNAAARSHVAALASGERGDIVWLGGAAGTGKSHLLQAACRMAGNRGGRAMYVALGPSRGAHPDQLLGFEMLDLLTIDEIDAVAGHALWEARLFAVLNHALLRGGAVLLAARPIPSSVPFELRDLASRAAGAVVYRLAELDEEGRAEALIGHARWRGLEIDAATARFLLNRVPRGMREICAWLDRLDRASLAAQRKLTIPFVRERLAAPLE